MKLRTLFPLLTCALFFAPPVRAQKAKFKNFKTTCQKTRLPLVYVDPADRTYDLYVKGSYSADVEPYNRGVYGWVVDSENPKMEAVVSLYGFEIDPAKREAKKRQKKDKDGKVTESWTEYTYSGAARGRATLYMYGGSNAFRYKKKDSEKSKAELAKDAQAAEKKKELEANPFLSPQDVADSEEAESDVGEDTGLDDAMLPLVKTARLDVGKQVKTKAYRSSAKAYKNYRDSKRPQLVGFRNEYPKAAYGKALNALNARYGYSPVNYTVWLKKMKSDKHPDFQMWNDACQATQTLFKTFRYNKAIGSTRTKFGPIVQYFKTKADAVSQSDRKGKNTKKSAFTNAVNIMYYLDQLDGVIAYCAENQETKFVAKTARKMLAKANRHKALMDFHRVSTCHLEHTGDGGEAVEVESEEEEPDDSDGER